ncbi:MAG: hypothetical protein WAU91_16450 [Desulfatitalea sp.]
MKASFAVVSLVVVLLGNGACRWANAQEPGEFRSVRIESHPKGGGYAHKTVTPDGVITGAHMSGPPSAVRVYETKDRLTAEDLNTLKQLVADLRGAPVGGECATPEQKAEGYVSVTIQFQNGKALTANADWNAKFGSPNFQAVWDHLHKFQVGAW